MMFKLSTLHASLLCSVAGLASLATGVSATVTGAFILAAAGFAASYALTAQPVTATPANPEVNAWTAGAQVLRSRIDEVMRAHEAGAMHFEIADAFRAEGYSVSGMDVRDAIQAYRDARAEDDARRADAERNATAAPALSALTAALRNSPKPAAGSTIQDFSPTFPLTVEIASPDGWHQAAISAREGHAAHYQSTAQTTYLDDIAITTSGEVVHQQAIATTGIKLMLLAYRANEGVIAVKIHFVHDHLVGLVDAVAPSTPGATVKRPVFHHYATEPGRWVTLRPGDPATIHIGQDTLTLKAF